MLTVIQINKTRLIFRSLACFLILAFNLAMITPFPLREAQAQTVMNLPLPGTMVTLSAGYAPVSIRGLKVYPNNPFRFDFIVDTGDSSLRGEALKNESTRLIKYFLATLTVPEEDLWVNLSPYEEDRIIPGSFGETEMGRDLLAQDYILKQITASLIYPENDLGKKFWDRVYAKAQRMYGTTDIPLNTFNKVWIVPESATVYENGEVAFVTESRLKVLLEEDYVALNENRDNSDFGLKDLLKTKTNEVNEVSSSIVREVVIPEIEKEVNEGRNFAQLRQIFQSMILATWFKENLKNHILSQKYVGQYKINGIDVEDKEVRHKIYQQYLRAFEVGAYNYIKEEYDPVSQNIIPKKYFSGGAIFGDLEIVERPLDRREAWDRVDSAMLGSAMLLNVDFIDSSNPFLTGALPDAAMTGEQLPLRFEPWRNQRGETFSQTLEWARQLFGRIPNATAWDPQEEIDEQSVADQLRKQINHASGVIEGLDTIKNDQDIIQAFINTVSESEHAFQQQFGEVEGRISVLEGRLNAAASLSVKPSWYASEVDKVRLLKEYKTTLSRIAQLWDDMPYRDSAMLSRREFLNGLKNFSVFFAMENCLNGCVSGQLSEFEDIRVSKGEQDVWIINHAHTVSYFYYQMMPMLLNENMMAANYQAMVEDEYFFGMEFDMPGFSSFSDYFQAQINVYRQDLNKLRDLMNQETQNLKFIGLESLYEGEENIRASYERLSEMMSRKGVANYQAKADEYFLFLNGPVPYMVAKGEVPDHVQVVQVEDRQTYLEGVRIFNQGAHYIGRLRELAAQKGKTEAFEEFLSLMHVNNINDLLLVTDQRLDQKINAFQDVELARLAGTVKRYFQAILENIGQRDSAIARNIHALSPGGVALVIGGLHGEGLRKKLESLGDAPDAAMMSEEQRELVQIYLDEIEKERVDLEGRMPTGERADRLDELDRLESSLSAALEEDRWPVNWLQLKEALDRAGPEVDHAMTADRVEEEIIRALDLTETDLDRSLVEVNGKQIQITQHRNRGWQNPLFARVGQFLILKEQLRKELNEEITSNDNVIFIEGDSFDQWLDYYNLSPLAREISWGAYTLGVIASMIGFQDKIRGSTFIEAGAAETGILGIVAQKLGAEQVILIESEVKYEEILSKNMINNNVEDARLIMNEVQSISNFDYLSNAVLALNMSFFGLLQSDLRGSSDIMGSLRHLLSITPDLNFAFVSGGNLKESEVIVEQRAVQMLKDFGAVNVERVVVEKDPEGFKSTYPTLVGEFAPNTVSEVKSKGLETIGPDAAMMGQSITVNFRLASNMNEREKEALGPFLRDLGWQVRDIARLGTYEDAFIAFVDGNPAGVQAFSMPAGVNPTVTGEGLEVSVEYRRLGIANALVNRMLAHLKANRAFRFSVSLAPRQAIRGLYEKKAQELGTDIMRLVYNSDRSRVERVEMRLFDFTVPEGWDKDQISLTVPDSAMTSDVGGIDFNPGNINIKREGRQIDLNINPQDLQNIQINGLTPVIFQMVPVTNLPMILGENTEEETGDQLSRRY